LVIAGTGSGVGKTSLTLGLARLLARRGLRVQTFKVGPDFLDPTYLALASGRTCYNLDGWMTSREYVGQLFARATADADIALVEGVMGMFDGASASSLEGSTAEIAQWLSAPVLLVVNAHGAARSLAATVQGFAHFEPGVRVAGVIANQGGSPRHRDWIAESLTAAAAPPLVGLVPRGSLPTLSSRHLGLVAADQADLSVGMLDELADACEKHLDVPRLLEVAGTEQNGSPGNIAFPFTHHPSPATRHLSRVRLGIARDAAFHFYYADNLESLEEHGVELVPFSPLADKRLPGDLDAVYFGGGYPELHAARLADNRAMLDELRHFVASGMSVYAECGGLMYLGRALTTRDGARYPLAGVLPIETVMLEKLKTLGYTEVAWQADCLWGAAGQKARGHEFHYSEITPPAVYHDGWRPAYSVQRRQAAACREGFSKGRVLAGYVHLHWASRPAAVAHFVESLERKETYEAST
jgi:cobyrinic acid a,c-diamide synthase